MIEERRSRKDSLLDKRVPLVGDVHQFRPHFALFDDGLQGSCDAVGIFEALAEGRGRREEGERV